MAHDHHHHAPAAGRAGARHQRALAISFVLVVAFLGVQVGVGVATGSLALLSDAGHMATDAIGLAVALLAIRIATHREPTRQQTFGLYRLEILAALFNAVLLFARGGLRPLRGDRATPASRARGLGAGARRRRHRAAS